MEKFDNIINSENKKITITVVSGKGGTGKTTISSSLSYLLDKKFVKADCDVDASNLGIILQGKTLKKSNYTGAKVAKIDQNKCISCGQCKDVCRYDAIDLVDESYLVNPLKCEGCNACVINCPQGAIKLNEEVTGEILEKKTNIGKFYGSKMIPGAEGSGKLVSKIRQVAKKEDENMLIDGSPGVGCSVMASITGSDYSIIVTEPTQSGYEDLIRVNKVIESFDSKPLVVINKFDINEDMSEKIKKEAEKLNIEIIGKIPFDPLVNEAINNLEPVINYDSSEASKAINKMYKRLISIID